MNMVSALVKRELLEGKNGYVLAPIILAAIALVLVVLTVFGFGDMQIFHDAEELGVYSLKDVIEKAQLHRPDDWPAVIMVGYWVMSMPVWVVLPFIMFFGLLGALYEERRDRSILFWKSMPVADWQEVLVKLAVPLFVVPLVFLVVVAIAQLAIALFMSIVLLFQGGDVFAVWPIGLMLQAWFASIGGGVIYGLWLLPVAAWVLFVSSFAGRMPFMWAVLPPVLIIVVEAMFFGDFQFAEWISLHIGGWMQYMNVPEMENIDGPHEVLMTLRGGPFWSKIALTFQSIYFWLGLLIGAGFIYGAIQMRKKAL